jgi:hypothetical protein
VSTKCEHDSFHSIVARGQRKFLCPSQAKIFCGACIYDEEPSDHRAFDGAYSAAFLSRLKDIIERRDWASEFA